MSFNVVMLSGKLYPLANKGYGEKQPTKCVVNKVAGDKSVCTFSIAVEKQYSAEKKMDYLTCVAWGANADFIGKYGVRGNPIVVEGRLENRRWTDKDGNEKFVTEVQVNKVELPKQVGEDNG